MGDDLIISAVVDGLIASPWSHIHSVVATLCAIKETRSNLPPVTGLMLMNCCDAVVSCQIVPGFGV